MPTIKEIRQQYPDYEDLSDTQLADALYTKHYSDMDRGAFNQKIGLVPDTPQQAGANALDLAQSSLENAGPKQTEYDRYISYISKGTDLASRAGPAKRMAEEESSFQRNENMGKRIKDTPLAVAKGVIDVGEAAVGLADITPLGMAQNIAGQVAGIQGQYRSLGKMIEPVVRFKDAKKELDYMMSPDQQGINTEMETVKGFVNTIKFGLEHPSTILQAVAESVPSMIGGAGIGRGTLKFFPKLQPYVAAAIGEGAISAGQTAEQSRQNVAGGNLDTAQRATAFLSGVLTTTFGLVGAGIAKKLSVFDIDTLWVGGGIKAAVSDEVKAAKRGVLKNALYSMVEEGIFQEWPQSMQEKASQNVIEGRPAMDGVVEAGAQGILSGMAMGWVGGVQGTYGAAKSNTTQPTNTVIQEGTLSQQFTGIQPQVQINVAPDATGRMVAMRDGIEIGSHTVGGVPILSDDIQGEERAGLLRQLMVNEPQDSAVMASDAAQEAGAPVTPTEEEKATTGQEITIEEINGVRVAKAAQGTKVEQGVRLAKTLPELDVSDLFDSKMTDIQDALSNAKSYYDDLIAAPVESPAFSGDVVSFTEKGYQHLVGQDERKLSDANIKRRLKLLPKVKETLQTTPFVDEIRDRSADGAKEYSILGRFSDGTVVRVVVEEIQRQGKIFRTVFDWEDVSKKLKRVPSPDSSSDMSGRGVGEAPSEHIKKSISVDQESVKPSLIVQVRAINDKIGEDGFIDLAPIIDLGRSIYESGANTLESFTASAKELFADVWDKVKDLVRQAWDTIANERGKIGFDKKGKNGKIKDAVSGEEGTAGKTSQEARVSTSGSVESRNQEELSTSYNQAETQTAESAQLKQSPTFEEFEKAVLGNANVGDTSMEDPLARGMTKAELRSLHAKRNMADVDGRNTLTSLREKQAILKQSLAESRTEARDLFYAGKRLGAFEAIEKMRAHQKELREHQRAEREFKNLRRWLDNIGKTIDQKKTIDPDHRKAVKMVLGHDAAELENWIAASIQTGDQFQVPQEQIDLLRDRKWQSTEQVLEDVRNQVSLIKQVIFQGRAARQIEVANKKFEFKEVLKDMVGEIRRAFNAPELTFTEDLEKNYFATPQKDVQSRREWMREINRGMGSALKKGEYIITNLVAYNQDKDREMPLFYRGTFYRSVEAERVRIDMDNLVNPLIQSAFSELSEWYAEGNWHKLETINTPTGPVTLERSKMLAVALNSGCEDNRRALREGTRETKDDVPYLTDEAIDAITDALMPEEKRFVVKVWDIFRTQLPHLQKAYKKMFGEDMVTVDGVYYPMFFDKRMSGRLANAMADQDLFQTFGAATSVARGRTMTRTGGIEALDLDPLRFLNAVNETNQFVAYGEAVRDINRILSSQGMQRAISDAVGKEYHDQLKNWLRRIANPTYNYTGGEIGAWWDNAMGWLRDRTSVAILGWGLSTAATQWLAVFPSVNRLGMANVLKGFTDFYRDWGALSEFCLESSGWLSQRVGTMGDITLAEAMASRKKRKEKLFAQQGNLGELMEKSYFGLISLTDKMITVPTWYSAYQVEFGKSQDHQLAVDYADMITRQTQSSASAKDLAGVQRGNNTQKAFVMFYSFFSAQFNEMARTVDLVKNGKVGMYDLMRSFWWTLMIPAIFQAIIKSRGWHDEDKDKLPKEITKDLAVELVGYGASSVPLLGGAFNAVFSGFEFRPTPVVNVLSSSIKAGQSTKKAIQSNRAFYGKHLPPWAREGGMAAGYLFRLPSRQIMRVADEAYDAYRKGSVSWENVYGLVYKKREKKK